MTAPAPEDRGVIAVEPRLVKELLVDRLFEDARAAAATPPSPPLEALLADAAAALGIAPGEAAAATRLARHGYEVRRAECAVFARAREPMEWLAGRLRNGDLASVSAKLACAEPDGPPDPGQPQAASWRVPGPGGHVRHWIASRAVRLETAADDARTLRRAWYYGFYLRCCEEASG